LLNVYKRAWKCLKKKNACGKIILAVKLFTATKKRNNRKKVLHGHFSRKLYVSGIVAAYV
jgi:hypothetical protein